MKKKEAKKRNLKSFFDLTSSERKHILLTAIDGSNELQAELVREYGKKIKSQTT